MHYMMHVLVLFLLCMGSFVNGDVPSGLKEDANMTIARPCIEMERQTLLSFRENLVDIHNNLHDWGSEEEKRDCCNWVGVRCNNDTGHVIGLDLSTSSNGLAGKISPLLPQLRELRYLNLSGLDFQSNPIPNFLGSLTNLQRLDISAANLSGPIPHQLANLSNLLHLDLSRNFLEGYIPYSFGNCPSLVQLDLSYNLLNGPLPKFFECSALSNLSLGYNSLHGSIPDFSGCLSLRKLDLSGNQLSGNLPSSLGQTSNLEYLDISSNSLEGIISDLHFLNLTRLTYLDMSFNSVSFELSSHGSMPFRLRTIKLQSCKLGPSFQKWLQNQTKFIDLDISSAGISDSIPAWFWDLPRGLKYLNLSSNEILGILPNMTSTFERYPGMDLSNNRLEGTVPLLPSKLAALNLSGNRFSGTLSFVCQIDAALTFLDLSKNLFSGSLPDCWLKFQEKLVVLNLSNNNLSGEIPSSLGFLHRLEALYLRSNAFVGELPISLSNCTKLRFADIGENKLAGNIPVWIGERLSELYVLVLRSNRFNGSLPFQICWLKNLQFLDLSKNGLSGNIPWCFGNFTAMASRGFRDDITNHSYSSYVGTLLPDDLVPRSLSHSPYTRTQDSCSPYRRTQVSYIAYSRTQVSNVGYAIVYTCVSNEKSLPDNAWRKSEHALFYDKTLVAWKGKEREFGRSLQLLKSIDLSSNNLSGKLPYEITSLCELVSLNFSINKLHGGVPEDMGRLKSLQSLDLSRNEFSGHIPSSLSQLTFLSYLDLSDNNFSGRIPSGTQLQSFNSSFYSGNPLLCGLPLTRKCGLPPAAAVAGKEDNEEDVGDFWKSYYSGIGAGFAVGFWGVCGALFYNRRCRSLLFASLSHVKDCVYVTAVTQTRKFRR